MARPLTSLDEILILKRGVTTPSSIGQKSLADSVDSFQTAFGDGSFCEELGVYSVQRAAEERHELQSFIDWDHIENESPVTPDSLTNLRPLFGCGDGHTYYFMEPSGPFIAHYHDPDMLQVIGHDLVSALNTALDANENFIPVDFSPVYWSPRSPDHLHVGGMMQNGHPRRFLELLKQQCSDELRYCSDRRGDIFWPSLFAHFVLRCAPASESGTTLDGRLYAASGGGALDKIAGKLREVSLGLGLHEAGQMKGSPFFG